LNSRTKFSGGFSSLEFSADFNYYNTKSSGTYGGIQSWRLDSWQSCRLIVSTLSNSPREQKCGISCSGFEFGCWSGTRMLKWKLGYGTRMSEWNSGIVVWLF